MITRFTKPAAIANLRAIILFGVPVFLLAALPLNLPFGDRGAWLSTALADSGSGSDGDDEPDDEPDDDPDDDPDDEPDDEPDDDPDDEPDNSGSGSSNSGSGGGGSGSGSEEDEDDDDDGEFSGDPAPVGGNLSPEEELLLIQNGWQKIERK